MTLDELLGRLRGVRRERPGQFVARCPAHDDGTPSLAVKQAEDGKLLLKCLAGCESEDVLKALGLKAADLFPPRETTEGRVISKTYPYRDERGNLLFEVVRFAPKGFAQRRPDGRGGWVWKLENTRRVLYRLPELLKAPADAVVFIPEGEKDVDAIRDKGLVATCNPHGAGKWSHVAGHASGVMRGRHIVVLPDNDDAGRAHAREIVASLRGSAKSVRVLNLPGLPPKGDASDWFVAGGTADRLVELARQATDTRPELEGVDIGTLPQRLDGERERRLAEAKRIIPYEVAYLDDLLGGMLPHDLVVLTARPGAGKTQLASTIAENAARCGRRALMFALEAERAEIERRMKYRALARLWFDGAERRRQNREPIRMLSYGAWMRGEFDDELGPYEASVDRSLIEQMGERLRTVYRGSTFTIDDAERVMVAMQDEIDLFVVDHLHYLDARDEETENQAVTAIMTRLRDLSLRLGKPVLLVAHLRKEDTFRGGIVPKLADLHGSSNITKIATVVIALAPAPPADQKTEWHLASTYMQVLKDRRDGAVPLVANVVFDKSRGAYRDFYALGRVVRSGHEETWEEIERAPPWARRCFRESRNAHDADA